MSHTLYCNEDNFLGLDTFDTGDINWFNRIEVPPTNPKGAYWHTIKGTGLNALTIYNYLITNNYSVPQYQFTVQNVKDALDGDTVKLNDFVNSRYWLIGGFEERFGVCFAIDSSNRIQIYGYCYKDDTETLDLYGIVCNTTTAPVSSGTTDNIIYFVDHLYDEGTLSNRGMSPQQGRYEVTVREDLQREWYYYNNIDGVLLNDTDNAWVTPLLVRKVWYYSPSGGSSTRSPWHDDAKNSEYSKRPDPYKNSGGTTKPDGGGGTTRVSVDIPLPDAPPDMLLNSGIVKMYKPDGAKLNDFIDYIYSTAGSIADNFKKIWEDPMNSIISLAILPFDVSASDTTEVVKFCGTSSNVAMNPLVSQFKTFDLGSLILPEETVSFLDYSSYTKVKAHLPFIGIVDLNTDDVMNATLTLRYIVDILTGDCVAHILCSKTNEDYGIDYNSPLYTFNGNMLAQAPLSGNNWQGLYSSGLRAAASAFSSLGTGNAGAVAGATLSAAVDFLTTNKVDVKRSGSIQGNASHLGNYIPYLIVECPIVSTTTDMYEKQGYPFNKTYSVKYMNDWKDPDTNKYGSGYTVFQKDSVFVENINATDAEKELIKNILETGIIFNPRKNK